MHPADYQRLPQEGGSEGDEYKYHAEPLRPAAYYGEGPFDPPSSEDEEGGLLLKEHPATPGIAERGFDDSSFSELVVGGHNPRPSSLRYLVFALGSLVFIAGAIGVMAALTYSGTVAIARGSLKMTMDHLFNGTFAPQVQGVHWVPEAGDGVFAIFQNGKIQLVDLKTNSTTDLVSMADITNSQGEPLWINGWKLSPDMKYILVKTNHVKQWRYSSFGNYYIHEIDSKSTWPMASLSEPPVISYATWSPTGDSIAFVSSNDLYILPSAAPSISPIRVTSTGNASLFNGVPDWVYEEEVFSSDYALWWSPNSTKLAFLRLDETDVDEFTYPIYNPSGDSFRVVPYPDHVTMKYPKPGYNNPLVSVHVFELDRYQNAVAAGDGAPELNTIELNWDGRFPETDSIISEVVWVGSTELIVKEVNRAAEDGHVVFFDIEAEGVMAGANGRVIRRLGLNGEEGDAGWIDANQHIYPLPASISYDGTTSYLDIVPTPEGYNHIALFSPVNSSKPRFLTTGEWEVTGGIQGFDAERGLIYFQAASPSSIERNIYAVHIPRNAQATAISEPTALTDTSTLSYHRASFSPEAGFYLLNYEGPGIPWQKIVQVGNKDRSYLLTDNAGLNETLAKFETPTIVHSTVESEGHELNVMELRPQHMDDSGKTKYPVLFRVYGGPGSQLVDATYNMDWIYILPNNYKYIVVIVDGRGTGFKGRKLRNPVKNNLGFWEVRDQINVAKIWAAKTYVDPKRIGIWGWSYGGFMAGKVVEANEGVHSLAISVAPVTSWRLYDSVYTERYMNLPEVNPGGYINASISNVTGFHNVDYLLAHGSGDDNVHYANSAHLLDMLTNSQVRRFRFRMFTDSDHSIGTRGAYRELFEFMTEFLVEKWGKGGKRRGW